MTFAAVLALDEADALALTAALGHEDALAPWPIDISETAPGHWEAVVYFEERPSAQELAAIARNAAIALGRPPPSFAVAELPETNWVRRSLAGLKPIRLGRFLVHGRHDRDRRRANDIAIEIEAAEAFGTGHHGSTAGCLAAIEAIAKARPIKNALDVGTGSGILAIAIARIAGAPVLASDIDPIAADIAGANAMLNRAGRLVRPLAAAGLGLAIFRRHGLFDLVVANILAGPLVKLAPAIRRLLAPAGTVVLSGLLPEQRARVVAAYRGQGLRLVRGSVRDGWLTLVLARKPVRTAGRTGRRARALPADGRR